MPHITWKAMADNLLDANWGQNGDGNARDENKKTGDERLKLVLLLDIARSLRVLRCPNFQDVPNRLTRIRLAAEGLRRDRRGTKRRKVKA